MTNRFAAALIVGCLLLLAGRDSAAQTPDSAFLMHLPGPAMWTIDDTLPEMAMLISLQGVANKEAPRLYFVYPPDWPFQFSTAVMEYYRDTRSIAFETLETKEQALATLARHARGYVVWDKEVRTSLIVAFTVSGLENAIVVSEELIPAAESAGLTPVEDFRGRFQGMSDYEIYSWAFDTYWPRTSKKFAVWMGGVGGNAMQPGVADYGIFQQAFFTDLSANPADSLEFALHGRLLDEMDPSAIIMGWHSYAKDTEGQHVTLISSKGLRMEGLNTLPNASFSFQIPATPGFTFKNNHSVPADTILTPEPKVYIACIQTDGLGIGAWLKPGRGTIPYAWEVTMNWVWLFPGQMQFFYDQATPNDYFIGALSGPGYMYPKAIPRDKHLGLVQEAKDLMERIDLRVFEIMDYSEGNRYWGNIDLTKEVVDTYYEGMPDAIGFVNGYGPAHTNDLRDGRPLISYDYYLSPTRPEPDAVDDLKELIALNSKRPYFLLMHVRESSDIARVKNMLDKLGPEVEVVPLDMFLKMAATNPTFRVHNLSSRAQ
ncbi:MAG TPA: GxGYxYP domain-containing protein [Rhodothermales bacterium]|nr:GxGYxYP domain-containing protein [Rhodothermales bacterium]